MAPAFLLRRTYPGRVPSFLPLLRADEPGSSLRYRVVACRRYGSDALGAILSGTDPPSHDRHTQLDSPRWDDREALPFFFSCSLRSFAGVQRRMEMRRVARKKPKEAPIRKRNRHSNEPNGRAAGFILSRVPSDIRSLATIARGPSREKRIIYIPSHWLFILFLLILLKFYQINANIILFHSHYSLENLWWREVIFILTLCIEIEFLTVTLFSLAICLFSCKL